MYVCIHIYIYICIYKQFMKRGSLRRSMGSRSPGSGQGCGNRGAYTRVQILNPKPKAAAPSISPSLLPENGVLTGGCTPGCNVSSQI